MVLSRRVKLGSPGSDSDAWAQGLQQGKEQQGGPWSRSAISCEPATSGLWSSTRPRSIRNTCCWAFSALLVALGLQGESKTCFDHQGVHSTWVRDVTRLPRLTVG